MARPPSTPGGRPHRITLRLSDHELAALEAARGDQSLSDYARTLLTTEAAKPKSRASLPEPVEAEPHVCTWAATVTGYVCTVCGEEPPA